MKSKYPEEPSVNFYISETRLPYKFTIRVGNHTLFHREYTTKLEQDRYMQLYVDVCGKCDRSSDQCKLCIEYSLYADKHAVKVGEMVILL